MQQICIDTVTVKRNICAMQMIPTNNKQNKRKLNGKQNKASLNITSTSLTFLPLTAFLSAGRKTM